MQERVEVLVGSVFRLQAPVGARLLPGIADVAVAGTDVVGADRLPARAAEDLVEGLAADLAVQVPEGDVEGRDGAGFDARAPETEVPGQAARQALDLQRV